MRLLQRFLAPILACLLLSGCITTTKLGGVVIQVTEISPTSPTQITATLNFTNENVVAIGVTRAKYKLFINGKLVARSANEEAVGLPQLGKVTQKVVFTLENAALLRQFVDSAAGNQASYTLNGSLSVYSGEDKLEISSSDKGSVSLSPLSGKL